MILKAYVHYYVIYLSTKNKMGRRGLYFYKHQKYRRLEIYKKNYFIPEILDFSCMSFFIKCSTFLRGIPLKNI